MSAITGGAGKRRPWLAVCKFSHACVKAAKQAKEGKWAQKEMRTLGAFAGADAAGGDTGSFQAPVAFLLDPLSHASIYIVLHRFARPPKSSLVR